MNIYSLPGHKVTYSNPENGYEKDQQIAAANLVLGAQYTVEQTVVDDWNTEVFLVEKPNIAFNIVFFDDVVEQLDEDDKRHPDYERCN